MSEDQPHRQRLLFRSWYSKGVSQITHILEETQWQTIEEEDFIVEMRGSSGCAPTEAVGIVQPRCAKQKQKILRRGGKNTQKNCAEKSFITKIITMV